MLQHRTSNKKYTTGGFSTTLLVGIAPITIYFLQLLGKVSTLAAFAAGVLIILKALIEWQVAMHRRPVHQQPTSLAAPSQQKKPARLVLYHPPVAGCALCQQQRPVRPYKVDATRCLAICQDCYCSLALTSDL